MLKAYANFDEEVGYCQSMDIVASAILINLDLNKYERRTCLFY